MIYYCTENEYIIKKKPTIILNQKGMGKMKNNRVLYSVMAVYACVMLLICLLALFAASSRGGKTTVQTVTQTEKEYIYVTVSAEVSGEDRPDINTKMTVRSYNGVIGVFDEDGRLIEVIDVYVKTLPETDRRLLEEGFTINSMKQLASIIEDYTG